MPPKIGALPLELLFSIVSYLNLEEFVKLRQTNRKILGEVLDDERINKEMVKVRCQFFRPPPPNSSPMMIVIAAVLLWHWDRQ